MPNTLYIMIGCPASGKSHWRSHYLGSHTLISPDEVIDEKWGYRNWSPALAEKAWNSCYRALGRAVCNEMFKAEDSVYVWDAVNPTPMNRSSILNFAKGAGWRVVAVFVDTPLEVCLERNVERGYRKIPENALRRFYDRLTTPQESEPFDEVIHLKHGEW